MRKTMLLSCALGLIANVALGSDQAGGLVRYFFKERQTLTFDSSQIAIFRTASKPEALRQISTLDWTNQKVQSIAGWTTVGVTEEARNPDGIRLNVQAIAATAEAEFVSPVFVGSDGGPVIITPDILVQFKPHVQASDVLVALTVTSGGTVVENGFGKMINAYRVRPATRNGFDVLDAANRLAVRDDVIFAEPDFMFSGRNELIPNDTFFTSEWGVHNTGQSGGLVDFDMDGPEAWDVELGDPAIIVVVIDNGVQQNHPDINQVPGNDVTSDPSNSGDPVNACDNHGTPVAGCISAVINNGIGVAGIAPACMSASVRTFISNLSCDGSWSSNASWTVNALTWAQSIGARVTNNSNYYGFTSAAINTKYSDTKNAGIVHFASAGNDSSPTISYPSSLPTVNSIAATRRNGIRASFSNWGNGLDFSAPGESIITTDRTGGSGYVGGDYANVNGTSFASPYSAGVAALILSINPSMTALEVEERLQQTCRDMGAAGYDTDFGWGMVNARDALQNPCDGILAATAESGGVAKVRYLSVNNPNSGAATAIRVRLMSLMHPNPPNVPQFPAPDYSSYDGQSRWVGPVTDCQETELPLTTFKCAALQCDPFYTDWGGALAGGVLHVTGRDVVPSSSYDVDVIFEGCDIGIAANYSPILTLLTARWGDVNAPFQAPSPAGLNQPNIADCAKIIDKFKGITGALSVSQTDLQPSLPDNIPNISDVASSIDAFKGLAYPFSGPFPCP